MLILLQFSPPVRLKDVNVQKSPLSIGDDFPKGGTGIYSPFSCRSLMTHLRIDEALVSSYKVGY